jgi:2-phosphosulfolactate phosphatase
VLAGCSSGRELIERGHPDDVDLAAALNASQSAPQLRDGAYTDGTR